MNRWQVKIMIGLLAWMSAGADGYAQMSSRLKQFLEKRRFPDLIEAYKQEQITIRFPGKRQKSVITSPLRVPQGYRCQVFASRELKKTELFAENLKKLQLDSVYIIQVPNGLYKVQIGDFFERTKAENLLKKLHKAGIKNAWIVNADYHSDAEPAVKSASKSKTKLPSQAAYRKKRFPKTSPKDFYYTIQVFATRDASKAFQLKRSLEKKASYPVEVLQQQAIWKVVVGKFTERGSAEKVLVKLRRGTYQDAWIMQALMP